MMDEHRCRQIDESPSYSSGGRVLSFEFAETRSRPPVQKRPAWRIAADRRARQLELLGYLIQKEERW
jgi:hypothetical protein